MTISPASFGLVTSSSTSAPTSVTQLRSHMDMAEPTSACSRLISAVMRDKMSPVRAVSKNSGESVMMWA